MTNPDVIRISRIDKFIFWKIARAYLGILLALAGAIWLIRVLNVVDYYLSIGAGGRELLLFCLYLMPPILSNVMAPCVLIALLVVYNQLLTSREYYVLTGAGAGPLKLFRPVVAFAGLVVVCLVALNFYIAPLMEQTLRVEREALASQLSVGLIRDGVFTDLGKGVTVFAQSKTPDGAIEGLMIYDSRIENQTTLYVAKSGSVMVVNDVSQLVLRNGTIETQRADKVQKVAFELYQFPLIVNDQDTFSLANLSPSQMMLHQLLNPQGLGITDPEKLSFVRSRLIEAVGELFTPIVLAFIVWAVVLGGPLQRAGYFRRIGVATLFGITFFGGVVATSSLIAKGSLPALTVFIYPALVLSLCVYVFILRNKVLAVSKNISIKT